MSTLRFDVLRRQWVIIAEGRAKRARDFKRSQVTTRDERFCPFCEGHESQTPPEIYALRPDGGASNGDGWEIRVVPNLYSALSPSERINRVEPDGILTEMKGVGAHEVLIEGPEHDEFIGFYSDVKFANVLDTYLKRYRSLASDPNIEYIQIFKNHGEEAGASLAHPHSQIIATPVVPRAIRIEMDALADCRQTNGTCLICDMIEIERKSKLRVVYDDNVFIAFAPYASRGPFEIMITPRDHIVQFEKSPAETIKAFAACLRSVLSRLYTGLNNPPFNYWIHTLPCGGLTADSRADEGLDMPDFHWHVELIPRLTTTAGFEFGTGIHINTSSPESAAQYIREIKP